MCTRVCTGVNPADGNCLARVQSGGEDGRQRSPRDALAVYGVRFDTGWDLACTAGTSVASVTAGKAHVTLGYYGGGYGNHVQVQVGDLRVRYAYLEAVLVHDGHQVAPGTVLGLEGSTGF